MNQLLSTRTLVGNSRSNRKAKIILAQGDCSTGCTFKVLKDQVCLFHYLHLHHTWKIWICWLLWGPVKVVHCLFLSQIQESLEKAICPFSLYSLCSTCIRPWKVFMWGSDCCNRRCLLFFTWMIFLWGNISRQTLNRNLNTHLRLWMSWTIWHTTLHRFSLSSHLNRLSFGSSWRLTLNRVPSVSS
jgi:hypothetical protein